MTRYGLIIACPYLVMTPVLTINAIIMCTTAFMLLLNNSNDMNSETVNLPGQSYLGQTVSTQSEFSTAILTGSLRLSSPIRWTAQSQRKNSAEGQ